MNSTFALYIIFVAIASLSTSFKLSAQTIEHSSGKCLRTANNSNSPPNGTQVVLTDNCTGGAAQFSWTSGGSIKHVPSNKCVHPGGSPNPSNGTVLVLWEGCDFADRIRFRRTSLDSLQQVSSGKCVHPGDGSANPSNGTGLVMWDGCNETRLAFTPQSSIQGSNQSGVSSYSALVARIAGASSGDIITLSSDFSSNEAIVIDKSIVLEGNGATINYSTPTQGEYAEFTPAIIVSASNVIIRNLTINGSGRDGSNTLVQTDNRGITRSSNLTLFNVTLTNATAGLRNQGIIPSNLRVENCTFKNLNKAIDLTRDAQLSEFNRVPTAFVNAFGEQIFFQNAGSLIIRDNRFFVEEGQNPMQVGIQIDGGNDGFNPQPAPGFPNNTEERRVNDNLIIKFENGIISNNQGLQPSDPLRASEFPIALAKVADVTISNNFVETVGLTNDEFDFSSGINVEHMSRDITISNNAIAVNRVVNGAQNNQGISVLPYQDHGNNAESEEATVNVKIIDNNFYGSGRSGIFGLAFRDLEINGNNFNLFSSSRTGLATINLFNTDDNQNGTLQENERSTLAGSFVNFGATTNLGGSGLVTATLFNTGDPSDLPPDQRH
ncbi:ricin-type beta-trefoil lectin domain protein [Alteromonas macleodii]|uniref:RICIN domain-containing protein n=1 Tax=Alteromonas TaxID=226 RepID=UPI001038143C|nr:MULTISPECIES: RICIN domain-containing protein [Alteromonas]TAP30558.1 hypothetical protein KUL49_02185 [Alteromonas sp. KUL17]USI26441.1 RICIN domain-containing protein [Alteromonas macleodii]GEA01546.1 hypothetical protein KUL17_04430 [Alteromonas sp. KUL17]